MHRILPASLGTRFVSNQDIEICSTRTHLALHIASLANSNTGIGFRQWNFNSSFVVSRLDKPIAISDDVSPWKAIGVPILLCVSFCLISVTKLWDRINHQCMCNGHTGHMIVRDSTPSWLKINQLDIVLTVTVKRECKDWIRDKVYQQHLSQWCHTSHRRSGQWVMWISMNEPRHAAFIHTSNCTTLRSDLVHKVEIMKIAYGRSWKSRRSCWIRKGEEVGVYSSRISGWIYMW